MLNDKNISNNDIFVPKFRYPIVTRGKQYFDVYNLSADEVFVDAGGYNGDTTEEFLEMCKHNYDKIYIIEPSKKCVNLLNKDFRIVVL